MFLLNIYIFSSHKAFFSKDEVVSRVDEYEI